MANFAYKAIDRMGRQQTGTIGADTRAAAMGQVMGLGLSPVSIEEQRSAAGTAAQTSTSTRVPLSAVDNFTRELANLLQAGLPLSRALHLLRREASHPGAKNVWGRIHDDVVGGISLAEALAKWPKAFSSVYVAMVRAGEAGGFVALVLQQIAEFRTREQDLKGKVKAAMIYPCVLAVMGTGVMIFLMTFFIPKFSGIFSQFGSKLPGLTQVIVGISQAIMDYGFYMAIGLAAVIFGLRHAAKTASGRRTIEKVVLKTPALGRVIARFALVRFCRMLGTLVGAGVPLVASLRVAREAIGNQTLADSITNAIDQVQRGEALSKSLASNAMLFPNSIIEMIAVAEETGRLDKELVRLSTAYEGDLDRNLRMLVALAEPAMLFIMAGLIGTVVVGMLLPVFTLQDIIR